MLKMMIEHPSRRLTLLFTRSHASHLIWHVASFRWQVLPRLTITASWRYRICSVSVAQKERKKKYSCLSENSLYSLKVSPSIAHILGSRRNISAPGPLRLCSSSSGDNLLVSSPSLSQMSSQCQLLCALSFHSHCAVSK